MAVVGLPPIHSNHRLRYMHKQIMPEQHYALRPTKWNYMNTTADNFFSIVK